MNIKNILLATFIFSTSTQLFPVTQNYKDLAKNVALAVAIPTTIGGTIGASFEPMALTALALKVGLESNLPTCIMAGTTGIGGLIGAAIGSIKKKSATTTDTIINYAVSGAKIGAACGTIIMASYVATIGWNITPANYMMPAITSNTYYGAGIGFKIGSFIGTSLILENAYNQIYYSEKK